jgi:hypothetical protein
LIRLNDCIKIIRLVNHIKMNDEQAWGCVHKSGILYYFVLKIQSPWSTSLISLLEDNVFTVLKSYVFFQLAFIWENNLDLML